MRAPSEAGPRLALAFRDHKRPSVPPPGANAESLTCIAGSHQRMFLRVKAPGHEDFLGKNKREVVSVPRWSTAAVLFGTAANPRYAELVFDPSRTMLHDSLVYGPWRVAGPFRVVRFVDRFTDSEIPPDQAWDGFVAG